MSLEPKLEAISDDRQYPTRPIVGVAGAVVRERKVLLIRRGREPMLGSWSLPGGALETGETILEGVVREVREETGLRVRPVELLAMLDRILRDEQGVVEYHYVLLDWLCELVDADEDAEACAGSDATEVVWVSAEEIDAMPDVDEAMQRVVRDALARVEARA